MAKVASPMYRLTYRFFYLISLLPFPLLYLFSDFLRLIVERVVRYRKDVITQNLVKSFPEKSLEEIVAIRRGFYKHFCDLFVETIKILSIKPEQLRKRCTFENYEVLEELHKKHKSVIIAIGHYGNWELAGAFMSLESRYPLHVIYKPLSNAAFDRLMQKIRLRFGGRLIKMRETYREMVKMKDQLSATVFLGDQTPSAKNAFWMKFMNQDTPVFMGTEKIARKLNVPVVFASIRKEKRGHYTYYLKTITTDPSHSKDGDITFSHTKLLELEIERAPETWLWSHRRWKHKRPN